MSDPTPNNKEFEAAEEAIRRLASNSWFSSLTPDWQSFLVSNTVETLNQYEVAIDLAAQKLIEFYVEIVHAYPEAKTMNPWEASLTGEGAVSFGNE